MVKKQANTASPHFSPGSREQAQDVARLVSASAALERKA